LSDGALVALQNPADSNAPPVKPTQAGK